MRIMTTRLAGATAAMLILSACSGPGQQPRADSVSSRRSDIVSRRSVASAALTRQVVWAAIEDTHRVLKLDARTERVLRRFDVPGAPHNITVSPRGTVVATLPWAGRIAIVRDGKLRSIVLGGYPHDVKIARGVAVVANEQKARLNRVFFGGRVGKSIPLKANPHDLAVSPNGRRAWVSLDGTDDIAVVNLRSKRVRRYISTGKRPHDLLFQPNGKRVWVTDWGGSVHVFARTGRLIKTFSRGIEQHHLSFTPDGRQVWVTDHGSDRVRIISTRRLRVVASKKLGGAPHHVAITRNGRRAVVADHSRGLLLIFSVESRDRIGKISVGSGPHGVWPRR